jgi:hypothetical protein
VAYAAEWDLDDDVLDREEVEAVVQHVAAMAHAAVEVSPSSGGLQCTFRFPVSAAAHVVSALDPAGKLLGDEWYKDLDPPDHGDDTYTVRFELHGPVDGGRIDDADADVEDRAATNREGDDDDTFLDEPGDDGDREDDPDVDDVVGAFDADLGVVARLRIDSHDNREAWPVAFAIAAAVVDRLGGDLRDDFDEDLYQQQLHLPRVIGPAVDAGAQVAAPEPPRRGWTTSFGDDDDEPSDDQLN